MAVTSRVDACRRRRAVGAAPRWGRARSAPRGWCPRAPFRPACTGAHRIDIRPRSGAARKRRQRCVQHLVVRRNISLPQRMRGAGACSCTVGAWPAARRGRRQCTRTSRHVLRLCRSSRHSRASCGRIRHLAADRRPGGTDARGHGDGTYRQPARPRRNTAMGARCAANGRRAYRRRPTRDDRGAADRRRTDRRRPAVECTAGADRRRPTIRGRSAADGRHADRRRPAVRRRGVTNLRRRNICGRRAADGRRADRHRRAVCGRGTCKSDVRRRRHAQEGTGAWTIGHGAAGGRGRSAPVLVRAGGRTNMARASASVLRLDLVVILEVVTRVPDKRVQALVVHHDGAGIARGTRMRDGGGASRKAKHAAGEKSDVTGH